MRLRNALMATVIVTMISCLVLLMTAYIVGQQQIKNDGALAKVRQMEDRINRIDALLYEIERNLSATNARLVQRTFGGWPR